MQRNIEERGLKSNLDQYLKNAGIDAGDLSDSSYDALKRACFIYEDLREDQLMSKSLSNAAEFIEGEIMSAQRHDKKNKVDISDGLLKSIAFGDGVKGYLTGFEPHCTVKDSDFKKLCLEVEKLCFVAGGMSVSQAEDEYKYKIEYEETKEKNNELRRLTEKTSDIAADKVIKAIGAFCPDVTMEFAVSYGMRFCGMRAGGALADKLYDSHGIKKRNSDLRFENDDPYGNNPGM